VKEQAEAVWAEVYTTTLGEVIRRYDALGDRRVIHNDTERENAVKALQQLLKGVNTTYLRRTTDGQHRTGEHL
jgi:hypothetical protein